MRREFLSTAVALLLVHAAGAQAARDGAPGAGSTDTAAQTAAPAAGTRLVVGVKEAPPFAILDPATGVWSGLSVELWREVAADLGVAYELRQSDLQGLLDGVADGSFDVGVGALTVTAERERRMDFSHPFFSSGLGIAVAAKPRGGALAWLRGIVSPRLFKVIGALVLVLAAAGVLVWLFERRANREEFGRGPLAGIGHAFWWSAVTMTTVGYGDKAPRTLGGRLVALVWMFASVIMISGFTAAIASSLTVARLELPVDGPEDLPRVVVATVPGSTSAAYLDAHDIRRRELPDLAAALATVAAGDPVAVVYDRPILRYLVRRDYPDRLQVLPQTFDPQSYAFALPPASPLREPLNRALLARLAAPEWRSRVERYLGEE